MSATFQSVFIVVAMEMGVVRDEEVLGRKLFCDDVFDACGPGVF